jgi:ubiquinone/menaquinone biosynthesis C-methylase UbiE
MTEQMVSRAEQNRQKLGYENVDFRLGEIEALPVESNAVDVVISNCVLNLVPDKGKAFQEIYRVLKPGGHFCISDIVLQGELPEKLKTVAELYAGCVAGAMQYDEYLQVIQAAGFIGIEVKREHQLVVTDTILAQYLSQEDIASYRRSSSGIVSITVFGRKPESL